MMPSKIHRGAAATEKLKGLRRVWSDPSGWEGVFINETTGACWRLDYPESEYHGGGSPRLIEMEPSSGTGSTSDRVASSVAPTLRDVAAKECECWFCGGTIAQTDLHAIHVSLSGLWQEQGARQSFAIHSECAALRLEGYRMGFDPEDLA